MNRFETLVGLSSDEFLTFDRQPLTYPEKLRLFGPIVAARSETSTVASWLSSQSDFADFATRELATREHPEWTYTRDPETGAIWFDDDSYVWFKLTYEGAE